MSAAALRTAIVMLAIGLAGGLGLGLWQVRETASQFESRVEADRTRLQAGLDRLEARLTALTAELERDSAQGVSERNDLRARLQDLTLAIDDLRLVAQPLIAEIPELPVAPQ